MGFEFTCSFCNGTGLIGDDPCEDCYGDGIISTTHEYIAAVVKHTNEHLVKTILGKDFADNLVATYKILEATDITEYGALSDSNKNAYNMLLQCGIVDLTDGTQIRTNLWSMFDSESTTRANLITLLGE